MSDDEHILVIREGHGANCSSIGSVIDTLFVAQVTAGALFVVVAAVLATASQTKKDAHGTTEQDEEER